MKILFLLFISLLNISKIISNDNNIIIEDPNIEFIKNYMKQSDVIITSSGLRYRILKNGNENNPSPKLNSPCECKYIGKNVWGQIFDTSGNDDKTVIFYPSQVIKGFGEALLGMKEGDKWEIVIPANLGYGKHSKGKSIPPGATLIFELELVHVGEEKITYFKREYILWILALGYLIYNYYISTIKMKNIQQKTEIPIENVSGLSTNPLVYLTISIDDNIIGNIEIELFSKVCPKTVENFRCLCTGEKGMISPSKQIPLHYKGSSFHRIIPNFMCQGGDITNNNGSGGVSIYGESFNDEFDNGYISHSEPYLLSMANCGENTNGSQFFITLDKTLWLDEKHVVFGKVSKGIEIVQQMAATGTSSGKTRMNVAIVDCGEIEIKNKEKNKSI